GERRTAGRAVRLHAGPADGSQHSAGGSTAGRGGPAAHDIAGRLVAAGGSRRTRGGTRRTVSADTKLAIGPNHFAKGAAVSLASLLWPCRTPWGRHPAGKPASMRALFLVRRAAPKN